MGYKYDAVVIGSGPNGYAAAIRLAQKKFSVLLIERNNSIGGGLRTEELTIPGLKHDVCSTMHPMAAGSFFFRSLNLEKFGLKWIYPPVFLAHPFENGEAAYLMKSVEETASFLDEDRDIYIKTIKPMAEDWDDISRDLIGPLRIPNNILPAIRFGLNAIRSNDGFIKKFSSYKTKALFTGLAAHGIVPTGNLFTAAVGLVLSLAAHAIGWPYAEGGSKKIAEALDTCFRSLGGEVVTGEFVKDFKQIPSARVILFNTSPVVMMRIMGDRFSGSYRRALKKFKYGPAAFKMDFALSESVPFKNELCRQAGFLHLAGTHEELIAAEDRVFNNYMPEKPFVLFAQPSLFDASRTRDGKQIAYAYCHVPNNSKADAGEKIISQIERFAPGFRDTIIASSFMNPQQIESYNNNYVGGDINGGMQSWDQMFTRPVKKINPYKTSADGVYICSSSTPPGGGVHGLCGYYAAESAVKYLT